MRSAQSRRQFRAAPVLLLILFLAGGGTTSFLFASCGPFTDVGSLICPFVLELYYSGITAGTSATTFSPNANITRGQMAVFTSAALDVALLRGGRRAALGQWWTTTPHFDDSFGSDWMGAWSVTASPVFVQADGESVFVDSTTSGTLAGYSAADGIFVFGGSSGLLSPTPPGQILVAMGHVFLVYGTSPGLLYCGIPSSSTFGQITTAPALGNGSLGIAFDGLQIWITNPGSSSVSIVTPTGTMPWAVSTVTAGFTTPTGIIFDGSNIWVTDAGGSPGHLLKLDSSGNILQTVNVGNTPQFPIFDGRNIWVPNSGDNSVSVVAAASGTVLATLTGNGLQGPFQAAFDSQRILVTSPSGGHVSLWKAADFTPLGSASTVAGTPMGVCSDGVNFFIALNGVNKLGRF